MKKNDMRERERGVGERERNKKETQLGSIFYVVKRIIRMHV